CLTRILQSFPTRRSSDLIPQKLTGINSFFSALIYNEDRFKRRGEIDMKKAVFQLEPLTCPSCVKKIETALTKTDGVDEVKVLFNAGKVRTTFAASVTEAAKVGKWIETLRYKVESKKVS